jgi:sigma-E factor negative regulatory protein RseA
MTQEISSLMDGELDPQQAELVIRSCCASEDQKQEWYLYHVIGDAMRGHAPRRIERPDRMLAALSAQPTVLAPRRTTAAFAKVAFAAAASVATIGVVGWIGTQGVATNAPGPVAKSASAIQPVANTTTVAAKAAPTVPTINVQDYLVAHRQIVSPEFYRPVNNRAPATR